MYVKLYLCACTYAFCFLGRGPTAFIRFQKACVVSRKVQNYCFQGPCTHLTFNSKGTAPWVTHRTGPEGHQRNQRQASCEGQQGRRAFVRVGFTSLLVRSFNLAIIPKTSFQKKRAGKNYHGHILHTLARIYLVQLQKECYTSHNLIQS